MWIFFVYAPRFHYYISCSPALSTTERDFPRVFNRFSAGQIAFFLMIIAFDEFFHLYLSTAGVGNFQNKVHRRIIHY
jgi:hypothetical protein